MDSAINALNNCDQVTCVCVLSTIMKIVVPNEIVSVHHGSLNAITCNSMSSLWKRSVMGFIFSLTLKINGREQDDIN